MVHVSVNTRMKSFDIPHKGLRNALSQLNHLAGSTDFSRPEQVKLLQKTGQDLFHMLTEHAEIEDHVLLAALEQRLPGAGQHNTDEHIVIEAHQARLENLLESLAEQALLGQSVEALAREFYVELNRFHSAYLLHMLGEEEETQQLLWEHFSDEELMEMNKQAVSRIKPEEMLLWVHYATPAMDHPGRLQWMRGMKAGAPEVFFKQILEVTKSVLPTSEFIRLEQELSGL